MTQIKNFSANQIPDDAPDEWAKRVRGQPLVKGIIGGLSGVGQTTNVNKILKMMPPVIRHNPRGIMYTQIPCLKLEYPKDSSGKNLCLEFFASLDKILRERGNTVGITLIDNNELKENKQ